MGDKKTMIETDREDEESRNETGVSRRDFFKAGGAAAVSAGVIAASGQAVAQTGSSAAGITWTYEADIIVIGGGCTGLPAAIRAKDQGASVIVVDQNFDLGGKMLHSGGQVSLGGGDPVQLRDMKGEADKEGFITVAPVEEPAELDEDVDFLFRDMTDWTVVDPAAQAPVVIVKVGGFLGLGGREVAIPYDDMTFGGDQIVLETAMTKDEIEAMPEYDEANYEDLPETMVVR